MTNKVKYGELGYITFQRTYARDKEDFNIAADRWLRGLNTQLKIGFAEEELAELRQIFIEMKGSMAGRFLWQLGTRTVNQLGLASLQNCAITVIDHPIRPFTWAMDMLMLGCGVGYNLQREYIYEIKEKVKRTKITRKDTGDADFIVPDTREGWVRLLRKVLESHFYTGEGFSYSTICVRGAGKPIKGFGGVASGPEPLSKGITQINQVLNNRANKKLRPIDALDIMNIIGSVVVAGNVRRSAQIAIGDADDLQFLNAKRYDGMGDTPNWRAMSNNSVVCNDITLLPSQFWEGYKKGGGEPYGLINLKLSRETGRTNAQGRDYPDDTVVGYNPCAEMSLSNYETCCLAELFLPNIKSRRELFTVATYLYRINKHSLSLKCHHPETEEVVHNNYRMGIGVTGYMQATEDQRGWLSDCYTYLRDFDISYSKKFNFPNSIKLTTVKPSGTLSLLAGVTPGCHPGYSQYFIRRIRIAADSSLISVCKQHGYEVELVLNSDGTEDHTTAVVSFPCSYPPGTITASQITAVDQLETVKRLQTEWSDNSVSCTIYYKEEELPAIQSWLAKNYNQNIKTCSFLLHSDHEFAQAPYEEITKEKYEEMVKKVKPITNLQINESEIELEECETGACPVK